MKIYFIAANYKFKRRKVWQNGEIGFDPEYKRISIALPFESKRKYTIESKLNEFMGDSWLYKHICNDNIVEPDDHMDNNPWELVSSWLTVESENRAGKYQIMA